MKLSPLGEVILVITAPLFFGGTVHASNDFFNDLQTIGNDRYIQSDMNSSDFLDSIPPTTNQSISIPANTFTLSPSLRSGLSHAARYLQTQNPNLSVAKRGVNISNNTLSQTLHALLNWNGDLAPESLHQQFDLVPLSNKESQSSKFTGYYTPIIQAQARPDSRYRYPIYRSPMSKQLRLLSRSQISHGVLRNKGLEVAWTNDPIGLFYMQIQGSGVLEYANGQRTTLTFDGSNEKPFRSLSKYMKEKGLISGNMGRERMQKWLYSHPAHLDQAMNSNPRYVYFKPTTRGARTASGMPIIPGHSVAVDTDYIPFGSVVLAEIPIINSKGQKLGAEWKILLPKDRGIAIKGPARMDIYTGKGEQARQTANQLTGTGRAYLLVNRPTTKLTQREVDSRNKSTL